jgi:uncharacterized membrane-anchored protein YitT (DUF2179 family)
MVMVVFMAIGVVFGLFGVLVFVGSGFAYLYNLAFTGLSIIALILIHQRKRSVVPFLKMYYAISFIAGLVSGATNSSLNIQVSSILWIIYLCNSTRVERTFTQ